MPTGRHINGSRANGSSPKKLNAASKKFKPANGFLNSLNSRTVILFVVGCMVCTIIMDVYFVMLRDDNALNTTTSYTSRVIAAVERPKQRQFPNIPPMQKRNKNFTTLPGNNEYGREPILQVFRDAGIPPLNDSMIAKLPTWEQVVQVAGPHPVIGGLDTCEAFKEKVPAVERMLGSAGMFNTGTNLVTHLLKGNCEIPERKEYYGEGASKEAYGMRWQVPWGKHSPAKYKELHATQKAKAINKEWIMPVVTIRHPYSWMHSMCKNGYTAKWRHRRNSCPDLKRDGEWNQVTTKFAEGRTEESDSLAHLWNDWYQLYIEKAKYPRLIVRMEDLVFHAKETTTKVCECVGGKMRTDRPFKYVIDSAKADSPGHDKSTGFVQAWIKYSRPMPLMGGFSHSDFKAAQEALNEDYMEMFDYNHAPYGQQDKPVEEGAE